MSEEKKRSGCKGCLIWFGIVFALFVIVIGVFVYYGRKVWISFRDQYTQTSPVKLTATSYSKEELDAVGKRIEDFKAIARMQNTNGQLSLSAADINGWLWASGVSNRVHVSFTNSSLVGQVSVPLEDLGIRFLKGRYLNGAGTFDVGWEDGKLSVKVKDIRVNGRPLPEHYMKRIRNVNYAEGGKGSPSARDPLQNISRVAIENGALIFEAGGTNGVKDSSETPKNHWCH